MVEAFIEGKSINPNFIYQFAGETKECAEFAKQFLERRSKYKNQMRQKNAHIDDMCKPAPAINPSSNDFQEIKVRRVFHGVGWVAVSLFQQMLVSTYSM